MITPEQARFMNIDICPNSRRMDMLYVLRLSVPESIKMGHMSQEKF
jgi:hypothetical protein